ncbi:helix-turn-helix domain-containing protein [Pseudoalteromonas sp. SaAl2]
MKPLCQKWQIIINYSTTTRILDALCEYFDCKIEEIITYGKVDN